jgi:hypothetical protein
VAAPVDGLNRPAGQGVGLVDPLGQKVPVGQLWHEADPAVPAKVPAGQVWQAV